MTDQPDISETFRRRFRMAALITLGFYVAVAVILIAIAAVGSDDAPIGWTTSLFGGWMAWTLATAAFFYAIAALLTIFTFLAIRYPETPRRGILGIETTRGDRLFITLLGSAFINLAWLGLVGTMQPVAVAICLVYAVAVFRFV
jgi:predicted small integral membrane protein